MQFLTRHSLISLAALVSLATAQAQVTTIPYVGTTDGVWSDTAKWTNGNVPDTNTEQAQYPGASNATITVNGNYTINNLLDGFAAGGLTLGGTGVLTIDRAQTATAVGIANETGNLGGMLRFTGNVVINNSASTGTNGITTIRNANSAQNVTLFDTTSVLTINTLVQTVTSAGGQIKMNGTLASSGANLQVNSSNLSFGAGHDSTAFGRDIVMFLNSKVMVDGAAANSVLSAGQKFQVNGTGGELELNSLNAINHASVVVGAANNFLLDVNASQASMGSIIVGSGVLTIDVDPAVTFLNFADSSLTAWGTGTVSIIGFQEGVISFGTDGNGLTPAQLAAINGGIYSLTSSGFLTAVPIPETSTYALLLGALSLGYLAVRRRRSAQA